MPTAFTNILLLSGNNLNCFIREEVIRERNKWVSGQVGMLMEGLPDQISVTAISDISHVSMIND
jgi:hypothetical protein